MGAGQAFSADKAAVESWLIDYLSELLELEPSEIDPRESLASYGLDSSGAVGLVGDLGRYLGRELDPALLYNHPTIESIINHLTSEGGA